MEFVCTSILRVYAALMLKAHCQVLLYEVERREGNGKTQCMYTICGILQL